MSIECAVCERDARGGHAPDCKFYVDSFDLAPADEDAYLAAAASAQEGAPYVSPVEHSKIELERLKQSWLSDPHWDLEDTEGFEAYHDQLKAFADEQRLRWRREAEVYERGYQQGRQETDPNYYRKQMVQQLEQLNKNLEYLAELYGNSGGR